ncbi:MAG: hypothetical protein KAT28_00695 [Candidatus Aenigmarchaeota archaeon]|nr:hypothetical protein [Candidatus Aenigmarchaeota archaeon]
MGSIPIREVTLLREQGKSDREIITKLKTQGFSFQAIEKAMLQVLKAGVGNSNNPIQQPGMKSPQSVPQQPGMQPPQQGSPQLPQREQVNFRGQVPSVPRVQELMPEQKLGFSGMQEPSLEMQSEPTDLIEEIVEGVVDEKFEKLDTKFEFIQKNQEKLKEDIKGMKVLLTNEIQKIEKMIGGSKEETNKLKDEIETVDIKCDALERAFKQFLPDLAEKVRSKTLKQKGVEVVNEEMK